MNNFINYSDKQLFVANTNYNENNKWYHPTLGSSQTISKLIHKQSVINQYMKLLQILEEDQYILFLKKFITKGLETYGDFWHYADICTVLLGLAQHLDIQDYLEIGVRRGRSMAMIAHARPTARIVGFDWWKEDYAGMKNPGAAFVHSEMTKLGHIGSRELISGDSHSTVPKYFHSHPDAFFDCITVDGDHSEEGAMADLLTVIPRLRIGGILVFDDIAHPQHLYLRRVWNQVIAKRPNFSTYEFTEIGYGVAFAVKMYDVG